MNDKSVSFIVFNPAENKILEEIIIDTLIYKFSETKVRLLGSVDVA